MCHDYIKNPEKIVFRLRPVGVEVFSRSESKAPGCGAEFSSKDELNHVVEKHDATGQMCDAKFNTKEELIQHNKEKHSF